MLLALSEGALGMLNRGAVSLPHLGGLLCWQVGCPALVAAAVSPRSPRTSVSFKVVAPRHLIFFLFSPKRAGGNVKRVI